MLDKTFPIPNQNKLALTWCGECLRENYAFNVLSGICTWCGHDVNKKEKVVENDI